MSRSGTRGINNEYKISEILGAEFRRVMADLSANGYSNYTYEFAKNKDYSGPTKPENSDLWYGLPQYLMAVTGVFKYIENPDNRNSEVSSTYAETASDMYDEIAKDTGDKFNFTQLPYNYAKFDTLSGTSSSIEQLVPGFHLFPYDPTTYKVTTAGTNPITNAILYLYHYIALLDTNKVNATELIRFLRGDNDRFMYHVSQISASLQSYVVLEDVPLDTIKSGVLKGLTAVATQIINELNAIAPSAPTAPTIHDPSKFAADTAAWLKAVGTPGVLLSTSTLHNVNFNLINALGANASKLGLSDYQLKKYNINSLLNPHYLNNKVFVNIYDPATNGEIAEQIGGDKNGRKTNNMRNQRGGVPGAPKSLKTKVTIPIPGSGSSTKVVSLPSLYGPKFADGKRKLTTENQPNTTGAEVLNSNLVNNASIASINNAIDYIQKIGDASTNWDKIAPLAYVYDKVTKKGTDAEIVDTMNDFLDKYRYVDARLAHISGLDLKAKAKEFKDAFVTELVRDARSYNLSMDSGKIRTDIGPRTAADSLSVAQKTNTLLTPEIKKFYLNDVLAFLPFYEDYFNLVRTQTTSDGMPPGPAVLGAAKGAPDSDLEKYRLNVKKVKYTSMLGAAQRGGAPGDIVLVSKIGPLPNTIKNIWFTNAQSLGVDKLPGGDLALQNIMRDIYASGKSAPIKIGSLEYNLVDIIRRASRGGIDVDYTSAFNASLSRANKNKIGVVDSMWKESEHRLREFLEKEAASWERDPSKDVFIKKDSAGKVVDKIEDNCEMFATTLDDCMGFFEKCLEVDDDDSFPNECADLLNMSFIDFDTNVAPNSLAEIVGKMNPGIAFKILDKFGFGEYLAEVPQVAPGFRRYKVQSVDNWLQALIADGKASKCKTAGPAGCKDQTLYDYFGAATADKIIAMAKDKSKSSFFTYLSVLVDWVNANPQVLNKEETKASCGDEIGDYPEADKTFRTYQFRNPYKRAELRIRDVSCGLDRLRSSILNNLTGAQSASMISTISSVPFGLNMPLARPGFVNPQTFAQFVPFGSMRGGSPAMPYTNDIENDLKDISAQYGYGLFEQLYKDFVSTMESLQSGKKMCLSSNSKDSIKRKLDEFKVCEDNFRKTIVRFMEQNKLYQASRGHINPYVDNEDDYKAILAKHSNLLETGNVYNKKAMSMIDLFQVISKAILGKLEESKSDNQKSVTKITRPMTPDYRY